MLDLEGVVKGGYCVGCGACRVAANAEWPMRATDIGTYVPDIGIVPAESPAQKVCPWSDKAPNETQIAERRYGRAGFSFDQHLGYYHEVSAGRRMAEADLLQSSSGGLTSWLCEQLLARGMVDGVIHVGVAGEGTGGLFEYTVSHSLAELGVRKKSQYYPTSFDEPLLSLRGNGKRYAFVGVPCYVRAMRLLCDEDTALRDQVTYFIGLVCGHLKSKAFAEVMAIQTGVMPDDLLAVDFRNKTPRDSANYYGFGAQARSTRKWSVEPSGQLVGGNWGQALFQLKACDYCDDIFAETADICFGDAWIPRYEQNWRGTNIIVSRNRELSEILRDGGASGALFIEQVSSEDAVRTQAGNFRHRWDGLSLRLADAAKRGIEVPTKRIEPGSRRVSITRRLTVRLRQRTATASHELYKQARQAGDYSIFFRRIRRYTQTIRYLQLFDAVKDVRRLAKLLRRKLGISPHRGA